MTLSELIRFKKALNFYFYHSFCINFLVNLGDNKLTNNLVKAFIKSYGSITPIFWSSSYSPIQSFIFISILTYVSAVHKYINEDLQKIIKLALESFFQSQKHGQTQAATTLFPVPTKLKFYK